MSTSMANRIKLQHNQSIRAAHYPLKQLKIEIQADRCASREWMLSILRLLVSDLESGGNEGESWIGLSGFRYQYVDETEKGIPSFFMCDFEADSNLQPQSGNHYLEDDSLPY